MNPAFGRRYPYNSFILYIVTNEKRFCRTAFYSYFLLMLDMHKSFIGWCSSESFTTTDGKSILYILFIIPFKRITNLMWRMHYFEWNVLSFFYDFHINYYDMADFTELRFDLVWWREEKNHHHQRRRHQTDKKKMMFCRRIELPVAHINHHRRKTRRWFLGCKIVHEPFGYFIVIVEDNLIRASRRPPRAAGETESATTIIIRVGARVQ